MFDRNKDSNSELAKKVKKLANGNTDVDFSEDTELQNALEELQESVADEQAEKSKVDEIEETISSYRSAMRACGDGDFTQRLDTDVDIDSLETFASEFNYMMDEVEQTTGHLKSFSNDVSNETDSVATNVAEIRESAEAISDSVQEINKGASQQSDSLTQVTDEMQNLSASIEEIAASSNQVSTVANKTAEAGERGREAAEKARKSTDGVEENSVEAVEAINALAEEISQVNELVDMIKEIAEQTNMLAINARVEAARAGEAGEGFAVVADEVKTLADEASEGAENIEDRLHSLTEQTDETVETVEETQEAIQANRDEIENVVEALSDISQYAEETNNGIQEISNTTSEQSNTTQQVVDQIQQVASISEETATSAEEVAAAAEEQTASTTKVSENVQNLQEQSYWMSDTLDMFRIAGRYGNVDLAEVSDYNDDIVSQTPTETNGMETRFGRSIQKGNESFAVSKRAALNAKEELNTERVDFCQVFASPEYDFDEVISGIRSVIGDEAKLIGCSSSGEFTDREEQHQSVAVALVTSDNLKFFTGLGNGLDENVSGAIEEAIMDFPSEVDGYPYLSAINLHDGLTGQGERIALVTQRKLGRRVNFAGGSAGDDLALEETYVFEGDTVKSDAVAMALIASKNPPDISANHGHTPISDTYTVTKSDDGTVYELDGRPAFEVWKDAVRENVRDEHGIDVDDVEAGSDELSSLLTEYELGVEDQRKGESQRIRWPGLTEGTDGPLDFVVGIPEGYEVRVMHSPKDDQIKSASEAAEAVSDDVVGAFVYDCVCRAAILGDDFNEAVDEIDEQLDVPFTGFETYGEICMERGEASGFHNTTSVILGLPK